MKSIAAFIVALSLFSATAVQATTDAGDASHATVASPALPSIAEISDALRLPGDSSQVRQPEQTAFIWWIIWGIHCADYPDDDEWCW